MLFGKATFRAQKGRTSAPRRAIIREMNNRGVVLMVGEHNTSKKCPGCFEDTVDDKCTATAIYRMSVFFSPFFADHPTLIFIIAAGESSCPCICHERFHEGGDRRGMGLDNSARQTKMITSNSQTCAGYHERQHRIVLPGPQARTSFDVERRLG